ncbi:hypothetical protein [Brazilian marseillevirus]|uniref:hypothetical protein n=1 Tax=Brazilian marseillevirus TaxID=1813599 RepID=UPI000785DD36|nr:hypothetical protein A3303_gp421 [Brazilian marseillevirus]AMQ10929.1 hypothetical protein [Brazilian marseillevirus]
MSNFDSIKTLIQKEIDAQKTALIEFLTAKFSIAKEDMENALSEFGAAPVPTKKVSRPRKPAEKKSEKVKCSGFTVGSGKECGYGGKEEIDGKMYCTAHAKKLRKTKEEVGFATSGMKKTTGKTDVAKKNSKLDSYLKSISTNKLKKNSDTGNLVHTEHSFVFDESDQTRVLGFENKHGKVVALTEAQKAICLEMGWELDEGNIPEQEEEDDKEKESDSGDEDEGVLDAGDDLDIGDERT